MNNKKDKNEEVHDMSEKFGNISTSDSNLNHLKTSNNNDSSTQSTSSKYEGGDSVKIPIELSKLKMINVNEKILFVIDTFKEAGSTQFELSAGTKNYSSLAMIKHGITIFVNTKSLINCNHEFGLMTLSENSSNWLIDFTNDKKRFLNCLEIIEEYCQDEDVTPNYFDMADCFKEIIDHVELKDETKLPKDLTRVIMIYSRSYCKPHMEIDNSSFQQLMMNPFFYLDILYVHETPTEKNNCEDIYQALVQLDIKSNSYIFEVGRNATILHNHMAKLMAHPLQRPKQDESCYDPVNTSKNSTDD